MIIDLEQYKDRLTKLLDKIGYFVAEDTKEHLWSKLAKLFGTAYISNAGSSLFSKEEQEATRDYFNKSFDNIENFVNDAFKNN